MLRYLILFLLAIAVLALALLIAGQLGLLRGKAPADLGVKDGKLKRISKTENSVSSQADLWPDSPRLDYARIAPFKITGDGSAEMAKIADALKAMPRTVIVKQEPGYLYAQCTTALMKYTDDVEFYLDASAGVIHVRSSSRLGQKDFGANRNRIEAIRKAIGQ
jgi:uncharacterized protein (DUF1499 family)